MGMQSQNRNIFAPVKANPLRKKIGIIGGGQLGRMMIEETLRYNMPIYTLDVAGSPCEGLSAKHITGSLMDPAAIRELAAISDVLTYEIEHIHVETLLELEAEGKEIIPSPRLLQIIQDKGLQKQFYDQHNLPTGAYRLVETEAEWLEAIEALGGDKLVAKTRTGGYDGKGVSIFNTAVLKQDISKRPFTGPALIEVFVPCQTELSVMVARDAHGNIETWPVVDMEFDPIANLVTFLNCPAQVSEAVAKRAQDIAHRTIEAFNGVGVFAVELLLGVDGHIYVNEVAPRPHNSGHHTIEACQTSQFEQLIRICAGMPLGSTELIQPGVMMNLLGGEGFSGHYRLQGLEEATVMPGVFIHLYGKTESKPKRKMGHVTVTATTHAEAHAKALKVQSLLSFVADTNN